MSLKDLRQAKGLTQKNLADLAKMNYRQIQRLESGERNIKNVSFENGLLLARVLGVAPENLLEGKTKMSIIQTNYNTVAIKNESDKEYIAIPSFEDSAIFVYYLPSGGAEKVSGLLDLPEDAEEIDSYSIDDCEDADAVYEKCERLLAAL